MWERERTLQLQFKLCRLALTSSQSKPGRTTSQDCRPLYNMNIPLSITCNVDIALMWPWPRCITWTMLYLAITRIAPHRFTTIQLHTSIRFHHRFFSILIHIIVIFELLNALFHKHLLHASCLLGWAQMCARSKRNQTGTIWPSIFMALNWAIFNQFF